MAIASMVRLVNICSGKATFSATVIELHSAPLWNNTPNRRLISARRASDAGRQRSIGRLDVSSLTRSCRGESQQSLCRLRQPGGIDPHDSCLVRRDKVAEHFQKRDQSAIPLTQLTGIDSEHQTTGLIENVPYVCEAADAGVAGDPVACQPQLRSLSVPLQAPLRLP